MRIVVVFDSVYGNTEKVARAIAGALSTGESPAEVMHVRDMSSAALDDVGLLVVGSPTRGFRPTPQSADFVSGIEPIQSAGRRAAAFDTRLDLESIHPAPLRWVINAGGYAAERLGATLEERGFTLVGTAGFLVSGQEGPLNPGELERAAQWAATLAEAK